MNADELETALRRTLATAPPEFVPVEIVVLNEASVDLVHRVLRDGVLLLDRDRSRRIGFEVKARNEYFDLQPHLARYRAGRRSGP